MAEDHSVMIWGCLSTAGTGQIHLCEGCMNQVNLQRGSWASTCFHQLGNSIPTVTAITGFSNRTMHHATQPSLFNTTWMERKHIRIMSWPAQSPDLNPIENLWNQMKEKMREHKPANKTELFKFLKPRMGCCVQGKVSAPRREHGPGEWLPSSRTKDTPLNIEQ